MAREYLMVCQEATYNTAASPTIWPTTSANAYYVRLDGSNSFTMRPTPTMVSVPYGGGLAIGAYKVSDKSALTGRLSIILCKDIGNSQRYDAHFLKWANTLWTAGSPWSTTPTLPTVGDLASCSIHHAIVREDSSRTVLKKCYTGVKVTSWSFEVSEDSQIVRLNLDLQGGGVTTTTFTEPTSSELPVTPWLFANLGSPGSLTANSGRTSFTSLTVNSTNTLATRWYTSKYPAIQRFTGRTTTLAAALLYDNTASPSDRDDYEAQTTHAATFTLSDGTHTAQFQMNSVNILTAVTDDLPIDNVYMQTLTLENLYDTGVSGAHAPDCEWVIS